MMTTKQLVTWIVEQQHTSNATNANMYDAAIFILALYALELDKKPKVVLDELLDILARIAVERVREFNLQNPLDNQ